VHDNAESLHAIVYGSLLAALLARDIAAKLNAVETSRQTEHASADRAEAFPPGAPDANRASTRNAEQPGRRTHPSTGTPKPKALRTFFAVALQPGHVFPRIIELMNATWNHEPRRRRRIALFIADAVLDGARSRSNRRFAATLVDQIGTRRASHATSTVASRPNAASRRRKATR
jgi:hypothetical protein